jgi:hypothetical protein
VAAGGHESIRKTNKLIWSLLLFLNRATEPVGFSASLDDVSTIGDSTRLLGVLVAMLRSDEPYCAVRRLNRKGALQPA